MASLTLPSTTYNSGFARYYPTSTSTKSYIPDPTWPPVEDWKLPTNVPLTEGSASDENAFSWQSDLREPFLTWYLEPAWPRLYLYNSTIGTELDDDYYDRVSNLFYFAHELAYELVPGGCSVGNTTTEDCEHVCSEEKRIFSNLTTLTNCVLAPYIMASINGSNPVQDHVDLAARYNLAADTDLEGFRNVTNRTVKCVTGYCADKGCTIPSTATWFSGPQCDTTELVTKEGYINGTTLTNCYNTMCDANTGTVDPDLGGIGVFVSYIIQLGISLGGYILLHLFGSWTYHFLRWVLAFRGAVTAKRLARKVQDALNCQEAALLTGLDEFHRTQCFFGGAIQIAAIVVMKNGNFNVRQAFPMQTNYSFCRTVAFNSITTIPFTFWYIRHRIKRSWYKFVLTVSTYVLAVATYSTATWYFNHSTMRSSTDNREFDYCELQDPTTQCALITNNPGAHFTFLVFGDSAAPVLPSVFMFYLVIEYLFAGHIQAYFAKRVWWQRVKREWKAERRQRQKAHVLVFLFFKCPIVAVYLFYFATQLQSLASFSKGRISVDDWNFGQVVGVTVWLPAILEFLQLALAGMKKGFEHRLPEGFEVTEEEEVDKPVYNDTVISMEREAKDGHDLSFSEERASESTLRIRHHDTLGIRRPSV